MAAELIFLEGGDSSATLVLGSPQMSTHLRVAQTSGTEAISSGPGTGAGEGTQAGRSRLAKGRDPKKWPVQHSN